MTASASFAFADFVEELRRGYPAEFSDSAWLLRRALAREPGTPLVAPGNGALAPFALEKFAMRGQLDRGRLPRAQILVSFFPARADYGQLFTPALEELRRRGRSVAAVFPPTFQAHADALAIDDSADLWTFATPGAYLRARAAYARLRGPVRTFASRHRLDREASAHVTILLQAYCWQAELFRAALRATGARVVFGIHFMLHPGLLGGVRRYGTEQARDVPVVLLQHGIFSHVWETHDFHGADRVLVWSAQAAEELSAFPGTTPPATVVGNPKLGALAPVGRSRRGGARPTVLVLGTNDPAPREREALFLAAEALSRLPGLEVVFRPHPAEPRDVYDELQAKGLVTPEQIRGAGDIYDAVRDADVVLGTQTTVLPEAVLLGVPAVQLLPERLDVSWAAEGMPSASHPALLASMVGAAVSDPPTRTRLVAEARPLSLRLLGNPRDSAERIADALDDALDEAPEPRREPVPT